MDEQIGSRGKSTLVIDLGVQLPPTVQPDITRGEVAARAGHEISALAAAGDRGAAVDAMSAGVAGIVGDLFAAGSIRALIGVGGSAGTTMATKAMNALPLGVPKVMVSTLAGGDVTAFVGDGDITMIPSIADFSGLNRISRDVLAKAAAAVCAMADVEETEAGRRPLAVASMFGNTTRCIETAQGVLESAGLEVVAFHATGRGGRTMELLISSRQAQGVLDATTTELADELLGGVMSAGPDRLLAAAREGVPAVVAPGCLDMVNFWVPESVPARYRDRRLYRHNPNVTLMRTTPEENRELGRRLSVRLNASKGPCAVYLPLRGVSALSEPGQPFHWPDADEALFRAIRETLQTRIPLVEIDAAINSPQFARAMARGLLELVGLDRSAG